MSGRLIAVAAAHLLLVGCFAGVQRASFATSTQTIDEEGGPSSQMSLSGDLYEFFGGAQFDRFAVFMGGGLGSQRLNYRTAGAAMKADEIPLGDRIYLGARMDLLSMGPVRFSAVGLLSGSFTDVLVPADDIEDDDFVTTSRVTSSTELGIQVGLDHESEDADWKLSPHVRVARVSQSGKVQPEYYRDEGGKPAFESSGLVVTVGLEIAMGWSPL